MKKSILLLILFSALTAATVSAQIIGPRSVIKTDLKAYVPSNFNLISSVNANYEYKLSNKLSAGLVAGALIKRTLELGATGSSGSGNDLTYKGEITPSGYFINPYLRMYTKESLKGLYFELFTRHYNYDFEIPYDYEKKNSTITANAVANAKAFGAGLVLGNQFHFGKMYVLDLYAGAGLGFGKVHAETNDPQLDAQDFQDIKEEMDNLSNVEIAVIGNTINNLTYDANSTSAWADISGVPVPMLRAGIAFGIVF